MYVYIIELWFYRVDTACFLHTRNRHRGVKKTKDLSETIGMREIRERESEIIQVFEYISSTEVPIVVTTAMRGRAM